MAVAGARHARENWRKTRLGQRRLDMSLISGPGHPAVELRGRCSRRSASNRLCDPATIPPIPDAVHRKTRRWPRFQAHDPHHHFAAGDEGPSPPATPARACSVRGNACARRSPGPDNSPFHAEGVQPLQGQHLRRPNRLVRHQAGQSVCQVECHPARASVLPGAVVSRRAMCNLRGPPQHPGHLDTFPGRRQTPGRLRVGHGEGSTAANRRAWPMPPCCGTRSAAGATTVRRAPRPEATTRAGRRRT